MKDKKLRKYLVQGEERIQFSCTVEARSEAEALALVDQFATPNCLDVTDSEYDECSWGVVAAKDQSQQVRLTSRNIDALDTSKFVDWEN